MDNKALTNKILKQVTCIDNSEYEGYLTVGDHYDVINEFAESYMVLDDSYSELVVSKENFALGAKEADVFKLYDNQGNPIEFHIDENGRIIVDVNPPQPKQQAFEVDILGQVYMIRFVPWDADPVLAQAMGYCDFYNKEIIVRATHPEHPLNCGNMDEVSLHTIRHEMTHAFMFESGLDASSEYARNEELIDWIALQIPKMCASMLDAQALYEQLIGGAENESDN